MSNKSNNTLSVPKQDEGVSSNTQSSDTSTAPNMRRGLSHLFHGTKKWGSFSKSTISKKSHADLHYSIDSNVDHRLRSFCDFFNCLPIFHPIGPLKCTWDGIVMVMLIYTSVEIPYTLSFQIDLTLHSVFGIIAFCIDICLCIDIILSFRTAYFDKFDHLKLIINPTIIAKRYLCGWFAIDLITSLPIEFMTPQNLNNLTSYLKMLRFFRLIRVVKILRLLKMVKLFDGVMKRIVVREMLVAFRLLKIISFMLLYAHFSACIWYYIGCGSDKKYGVSWISEKTDLVTECHDHSASAQPDDTFTRYSYAWYWSVVTLFTTGYGDITATNIEEQWVASVSILIGTGFFAYFVGTLTTLISEGDRISSETLSKMEEAQHFCDKKKLPREMARAVLTHTRYHCNYNCIWDEHAVLSNLPPYLQMDISLYVAKKLMLANIDFFDEAILDPVVRGTIALKMRSISCNNGYKLYKEGDLANEIYIQRTGTSMHLIETKLGKKKKIQLNRGDVCGEYSLITKRRVSTVLCATWCEFYVIEINDIMEALQEHYGSRWEKKWLKIKKFVKKEYKDQRWGKKRHLALQRRYTPSNVYSQQSLMKRDPNEIEMHAMWSEAAIPSIRSTIRSEGVSDNIMFQHIVLDSDLNAQEYNMDTDIKHDIGISMLMDDHEPSPIVKNINIHRELAAATTSTHSPIKDQHSPLDTDPVPHAFTINEAHLSSSKPQVENEMLRQTKAKSFDEHLVMHRNNNHQGTTAKRPSTTKATKSAKSPLRWLPSFRDSKKNERDSKKLRKKKSVWFGLTRQNSELRDQVVVAADTINIDKMREMFADYSSESEDKVTITRAKSEHHINTTAAKWNGSNSFHDLEQIAAVSEPNFNLQRSRSLGTNARVRMTKTHHQYRKHKEKYVDNVETQIQNEEDRQTYDGDEDDEDAMSIDSANTDSISVNNDGSASESSNTLQLPSEKHVQFSTDNNEKSTTAAGPSVKSKANKVVKGSGGSKVGKFKMKKRVKKHTTKHVAGKMVKMNMEHDAQSEESDDLPNTSMGTGLIRLSEIEEDTLLNKSFSTSNKSKSSKNEDTNDANGSDDAYMKQLSLVLEENNENDADGDIDDDPNTHTINDLYD